jgi:hypothetical protein
MADKFFYISAALSVMLAIFIGIAYGTNLQPTSMQNKSLVTWIIVVSVAASVLAWLMAYIGLKGNVTAQVHFLIVMVAILFAMNVVSGSVGVQQLYGLRDAIAANTQV